MNRFVTGWRRLNRNIKTIFGMPDYERYLEHHRQAHPDQTPLSEREYYKRYLKDRYDSGQVNRCC
ncbi:YbdD/YjiX family protein [Alicyclobacillus sp.]|uniref:YbdD/YjiX family protein n=1 Tax=Alicyclobacillus sp. TaxID=61169 RepID=UPI0025B9CDFF|nr:YbdD/YjiX family protein [Alicyclobacillus sp.]MCL6517863.1 YbdD/YjiX family protein [Alicyclobacillus sp.]